MESFCFVLFLSVFILRERQNRGRAESRKNPKEVPDTEKLGVLRDGSECCMSGVTQTVLQLSCREMCSLGSFLASLGKRGCMNSEEQAVTW